MVVAAAAGEASTAAEDAGAETRRPTHARKSHSVYLDGQGSARVLGLDEAAEAVAGGVER